MYILSQSKTAVYKMDELQTIGQCLAVTNASRKQKVVASYETAEDCKLAMRIIIGAMETSEKHAVVEAPQLGQIAEVKTKIEQFKKAYEKENGEAAPKTLDDLLDLLEKIVKEELEEEN